MGFRSKSIDLQNHITTLQATKQTDCLVHIYYNVNSGRIKRIQYVLNFL